MTMTDVVRGRTLGPPDSEPITREKGELLGDADALVAPGVTARIGEVEAGIVVCPATCVEPAGEGFEVGDVSKSQEASSEKMAAQTTERRLFKLDSKSTEK